MSLNFSPRVTLVPEVSNSPPKSFNLSHWIKMVLGLMWHAIYSRHVNFSCPWMSQYVIMSHLTLVSSNYNYYFIWI